MTNQERAEKIATEFGIGPDRHDRKEAVDFITSHLDGAVKEHSAIAVREAFANGRLDAQYDNDTLSEQIEAYKHLAYSQGFASAIEKAASVCEDLECLDEDHQACVAERARALRAAEKAREFICIQCDHRICKLIRQWKGY